MNKMKTKRKLVLSFSLIFIALFVVSITTNAATNYTIEYPLEVRLGETIDINIIFDYEYDTDCIYSSRIWFYCSVNNEITTSWTSGISKTMYNLDNYPRPANVPWAFNTSVMFGGTLEEGDIFRFRIKFTKGVELDGIVHANGIEMTSVCEILIREAATDKTSAEIITSMFVLAAIVIFTRKKKINVKR